MDLAKNRLVRQPSGWLTVMHPLAGMRVRLSWLVLAAVLIGGGVYARAWLDRGWVPHDEGMLGQSAERVMRGELPHRDFDEPYSGGLSYVHALAFRLFGVNLLSPRLMLYGGFLLWMPAVAYVASRFTTPLGAAGVTALAVVWSIPNYSAAIPSWYNLFLATFGLASLARAFETRKKRWLVLAGVCGGLSTLIKIAGLYFLAAGLLAILFADQTWRWTQVTERALPHPQPKWHVGLASLGIVCGLVAFSTGLLAFLRQGPTLSGFTHVAFPGLALAAVLVRRELLLGARSQEQSCRSLGGWVGCFLAGALAPVLLFGIPYLLSGSLPSLLHGVFVAPRRRVALAAYPFPALWEGWLAIPVMAVLFFVRGPHARRSAAAAAIAGAVALLAFGARTTVYLVTFNAIRLLVPCAVAAAAVVLVKFRVDRAPGTREAVVFACASTAALCSLVQFPFAAPIYFFYVAPLGGLALLGAVSSRPPAALLHAGLLVAVALFTARYVTPGSVYEIGNVYAPNRSVHRLKLPRGKLLITAAEKVEYERLVLLIVKHSGDRAILATPDCPEVYFLSGKKNPTRALFEFLALRRSEDPLMALDRVDPSLVVLNGQPGFSPRPPQSVVKILAARYPYVEHVGRFAVRWR